MQGRGAGCMDDLLFRSLESGATAVTQSHRQARSLQLGYARRMVEGGHAAWPAPDIVTWDSWTRRCWSVWQDSRVARGQQRVAVLLSAAQETRLWEAVVRDSVLAQGLMQVTPTAAAAAVAWKLSWEWKIPVPSVSGAAGEDVRAFAAWAAEFDARCRSEGWQDRARLPDVLAAASEGGIPFAQELVLFGFDELTPQQCALLGILERSGTVLRQCGPLPLAGTATRRVFPDSAAEIAAVAGWARDALEAGATGIGIVIPDLATRRSQVIRIFDDVLLPAVVLDGSATARPYNLSLGLPLAEYPAIITALRILALGAGDMACGEMGSLLRSSFIGGSDEEQVSRAMIDVACRAGDPLVDAAEIIRIAQGAAGGAGQQSCRAPELAARLKALQLLWRQLPARQAPSAWAEVFAQTLAAAGWPGDRPLDSAEYQQSEAWRELLGEFSSLDRVAGSVDYPEALQVLRRMASERIFQPQSAQAPIQVMGLLEAAGLTFDRLWVLGLHDAVWPQSPQPSPFIDPQLQRRHRLPHSSAAREHEFAQHRTAALLVAAWEVVASSPLRQGEEDLRPSPLIAHLPLVDAGSADPQSRLARRVHEQRPALEDLVDERAPAVSGENTVPLGTGVFRDQAACPFRAFARARLGARALASPGVGPDAADRGILLHEALRLLWTGLGSHSALVGLTREALVAAADDAGSRAIGRIAAGRPRTFPAGFQQLERERLCRLVLAWLDQETARLPFVVISPEQQQTAIFGGVRVRIVPDRVDRIEGGGQVVIDYKTGDPSLGDWFGERPDDPQLPIYALAQDDVAALAFARVRVDGCGFEGIGRLEGIAPGIGTVAQTGAAKEFGSWGELLAGWRAALDALGRSFRDGAAQVAPKNGSRTCEYCDLGPLCRIADDGLPDDGDAGGQP